MFAGNYFCALKDVMTFVKQGPRINEFTVCEKHRT